MAALKRIGRLRHRIQLQRQAEGGDNLGRQKRGDEHWTTYNSRFAEIRELSGREVEIAHKIHAQASHLVAIRHLPDLTEKDRVLFRGRVLEIKAILDDDNTRRELTLLCGEER
jgi:SPP1 family predicted phage head-tail adaptor